MKFIDKQLAMILKEKGFNKPCFGWYYINTPTENNEGELILNHYPGRGGTYKEALKKYILPDIIPNIVDAPTIEQVLEWLREERKIHVEIEYMPKINDNEDYYYPCIKKIGNYEPTNFGYNENFNSYDNAAISGIKYVVNNLI